MVLLFTLKFLVEVYQMTHCFLMQNIYNRQGKLFKYCAYRRCVFRS